MRGTQLQCPIPRIFINPPTLAAVVDDYRDRLNCLGYPYVVNRSGRALNQVALQTQAETALAIIAGLETLNAAFFERAKQLKIIAKYGVGYDNIDLNAARAHGVQITRTCGSNTQSVADCAFSAILALLHRFPQRHTQVLAGEWDRTCHSSAQGHSIAIIGFGRIGSCLAKHAKYIGWHVLAVDKALKSNQELINADELCRLDDALQRADIVSLHYPRTNNAVDFTRAQFNRMKDGAIFINMARGGLVDEGALADMLKSGKLSGAALDVFQDEPLRNPDRWRGIPNLLLTPHIAGSSHHALRNGFEMSLETIEFALGLRKDRPRAQFIQET